MSYGTSRYDCTDPAKLRFLIRHFPFAVLIPIGAEVGTVYLPFAEVPGDEDPGRYPRMFGHFDMKNPMHGQLDGAMAKAIFVGPNGYVSPSDYVTAQYPTWNYACVEIEGRISFVDDPDEKRALMLAQLDVLDDAGTQVVDTTSNGFSAMMNAITFFTLETVSAVGRFKFSQEKSLPDRQGAADQLQRKISARTSGTIAVLADLSSREEKQGA